MVECYWDVSSRRASGLPMHVQSKCFISDKTEPHHFTWPRLHFCFKTCAVSLWYSIIRAWYHNLLQKTSSPNAQYLYVRYCLNYAINMYDVLNKPVTAGVGMHLIRLYCYVFSICYISIYLILLCFSTTTFSCYQEYWHADVRDFAWLIYRPTVEQRATHIDRPIKGDPNRKLKIHQPGPQSESIFPTQWTLVPLHNHHQVWYRTYLYTSRILVCQMSGHHLWLRQLLKLNNLRVDIYNQDLRTWRSIGKAPAWSQYSPYLVATRPFVIIFMRA